MTNVTKINPSIPMMRFYSMSAQRRALRSFFEVATAYWSLDAQDAMALLGLGSPDFPEDSDFYFTEPMPPVAQRSLLAFEELAYTYKLMPNPFAYNGVWLHTPDEAFDGSAPIDLILTRGVDGIKKIGDFLSQASVRQYVKAIGPVTIYEGEGT